jgi:ATP-binding cassette subfamily B protein
MATINILPRIVAFALSFIIRFCPLQTLLLVVVTVIGGLLPAVQVYVGKLLLDAIVSAFQSGESGIDFARLMYAFGYQLAVLLTGASLSQVEQYLNFAVGRRLAFFMQIDNVRKVSNLDFSIFDDPDFQDRMLRAQQECSGRPLSLLTRLTMAARGIITFVSLTGVLLSFGWSLFVVSVITCVPLLLIQVRYGRMHYQLLYDRAEESRRSGHYSGLMTSKYARPEVCSYGLFDFLFSRWRTYMNRFLDQDFRLQRRETLAHAGVHLLSAFSNVGVTAYVAYTALTKRGNLTVGDIMMFSGSFSGATAAFRSMIAGVAGVYRDSLFLENLRQFHHTIPASESVDGGQKVPRIVESIKFENVSFTYPGRQSAALRNINLVFSRTCSTLLVGANGAGKTTLMKLLMRLYDPTEGRILINGADIREYDIHSLRRTIGIIFQNFQRYAFSAQENIGCGCVEKINEQDRIFAAARRAQADEFIRELPRGYATPLTRMFAAGQELSGGQWQRICLARLFMKDPPVFIFDEPTANLDVEAEASLLEEIQDNVSSAKLCILISHRMFRPGLADHIVVLSRGTVLEEGTYDDLVARNGEFARLRRLFYRSSRMASVEATVA